MVDDNKFDDYEDNNDIIYCRFEMCSNVKKFVDRSNWKLEMKDFLFKEKKMLLN